ncbi:MAG: DoxX family protein [Pseudomonadota bacterium]
MLTALQNPCSLIGRALLALLFIPAGIGKLWGFSGTMGYIASKGVPLPGVAAAMAIAIELGLGLFLLVGFQARWAALAMALFTLVVSFIFHPYWADPSQYHSFFKNIAVVGGLLTVAAWGAGAWSVDGRRA